MKKLLLVAVAAALLIAPAAQSKPSLAASATTVAAGGSFTLTGCISTSGYGVYFVVEGPGTFSQVWSYGPVTGSPPCFSLPVGTAGWPVGKTRINGYEHTAKGSKSIGSVTITIT